MTYLAYNTKTERIKRRAWIDDEPIWFSDPADGCAVAHEPDFSQASLREMMRNANAIHDAGTDYDPEAETSVGYLCYNDETGEIYPEADLRPLPDDDE